MGVPDLLRYVARETPDAMRRTSDATLYFDYVLIDTTNCLQTLQFDTLRSLILHDTAATEALIFVLDGQRQRQGTVREQRHFLQQRESDVAVQRLALDVVTARGARVAAEAVPTARRPPRAETAPSPFRVVLLGRDIAGEGDYKLLALHRRLHAAHRQRSSGDSTVSSPPTFLLVSEDSDVLCGALLGPDPHCITIATNLCGALHELHLLDVGTVARQVAQSSGAMLHPSHGIGDDAAARRQLLHGALLDFIFVFSLVLGTTTTPSLTRGATRVDVGACWSHYSAIRRGEQPLRRGAPRSSTDAPQGPLLRATPDDDSCSVVLDADFLFALLEARFADDVSHIPTAAEREYARSYVRHVVQTVVGLLSGAPSDTRGDTGKFSKPPLLSSIMAVLEHYEERVYALKPFDFVLRSAVDRPTKSDEEARPVHRVPVFVAAAIEHTIQQSKAVALWPPRDTRPVTGSPSVLRGEVALPLASPLNVPVGKLLAAFTATLQPLLNPLPPGAGGSALLASASAAAAPPPRMRFDFDMRCIVPTHPKASGVATEDSSTRILALSGLSTDYFAQAPTHRSVDDPPRPDGTTATAAAGAGKGSITDGDTTKRTKKVTKRLGRAERQAQARRRRPPSSSTTGGH